MRKFALLFLILCATFGLVAFALAITFDYDVIPNFGNVFSIGFSPSPRWKNFNLSNKLYAGNRITIGSTTLGEVFKVVAGSTGTAFSIDAGGNIKIGYNLLYLPKFSSNPSESKNGSIYYQDQGSNQKFRVFEGGLWRDVIGAAAQLFWDDQGVSTWNIN